VTQNERIQELIRTNEELRSQLAIANESIAHIEERDKRNIEKVLAEKEQGLMNYKA
jgi:hypothetical protein